MVVYIRCRIRLKSQNTKAVTFAIVVLELTSVCLASSWEPTDKFDAYKVDENLISGKRNNLKRIPKEQWVHSSNLYPHHLFFNCAISSRKSNKPKHFTNWWRVRFSTLWCNGPRTIMWIPCVNTPCFVSNTLVPDVAHRNAQFMGTTLFGSFKNIKEKCH